MQPCDLDAHMHAQLRIELERRSSKRKIFGLARSPADRHRLRCRPKAASVCGRAAPSSRIWAARSPSLSISPGDTGEAERKTHILAHRHMRIKRIGLEHHAIRAWTDRHRSFAIVDRQVAEVISSSPAIIRSSGTLPQPEGPTKTTNSPDFMSQSTPLIPASHHRITDIR